MLRILLAVVLAALLSGCGYNQIQAKDEAVSAAWSQVLNVYKRRADLVPNLVATVKGYAAHEERVLTEVTDARAKVGSLQVDAGDPESLQRFQQAQGELQGAIARLLVVSENYPQLKADQNFLQLQAQLEGTENRIAVERQRYIAAVQDYNTYIRRFPVNLTAKLFDLSFHLLLFTQEFQRNTGFLCFLRQRLLTNLLEHFFRRDATVHFRKLFCQQIGRITLL